MQSKVLCHSVSYETAAIIFIKVVSRYGKLAYKITDINKDHYKLFLLLINSIKMHILLH